MAQIADPGPGSGTPDRSGFNPSSRHIPCPGGESAVVCRREMPFTISHAGFVLPLRGRVSAHVLCGLITGSVAPDFPYFVRAFGVASFAHTGLGALCVSLPIGWALYLIFRLSFRRIILLLPKPHADFIAAWGLERAVPKHGFIAIGGAIFGGALFHNFCDSFTHKSGVAVSMFPVLSREVFSIGGEPLPLFRILQYSGSILGLMMICGTYFFALRRHCRARGRAVGRGAAGWRSLLSLMNVTMGMAVVFNAEFIPRALEIYPLRVFAFQFLITWGPIVGLAFLCLAMIRGRPKKQPAAKE